MLSLLFFIFEKQLDHNHGEATSYRLQLHPVVANQCQRRYKDGRLTNFGVLSRPTSFSASQISDSVRRLSHPAASAISRRGKSAK